MLTKIIVGSGDQWVKPANPWMNGQMNVPSSFANMQFQRKISFLKNFFADNFLLPQFR